MTKGQYRVGVSFNPGGHESVNQLKELAASYIDAVGVNHADAAAIRDAFVKKCNKLRASTHEEAKVCFDTAINYAVWAGEYEGSNNGVAEEKMETAAMWAVKAATKPEWVEPVDTKEEFLKELKDVKAPGSDLPA